MKKLKIVKQIDREVSKELKQGSIRQTERRQILKFGARVAQTKTGIGVLSFIISSSSSSVF